MFNTFFICILTLTLAAAAHADFSYSTTRKTTGGMMASMAANAGPRTTHYLYKGQKMMTDDGETTTILDFEAQTLTLLNRQKKTYTVKAFSELGDAARQTGADITIDAKETGQKKTVNGFSASELLITLDVESPQMQQMGKMRMEVDVWLTPDVPGSGEMRAFYEKNASKFPWTAMAGAGNPGMQKAFVDLQRKIASMHGGVPVEQTIRVKAPGMAAAVAGSGASPEKTRKVQDDMAKACAQLEQLKAQGGPAAAMAEQQMAKLCGGSSPGAASDSLMEITMTSGEFSSAGLADSTFAIPAGFTKAN